MDTSQKNTEQPLKWQHSGREVGHSLVGSDRLDVASCRMASASGAAEMHNR